MANDPFSVLGLSSTATDDEVKKAYRQLAKKYHPDANPGDKAAEQKMKEINNAYDQIINKKFNNNTNGSSQTQYRQEQNPFGGGDGSFWGFDPFGFGFGGFGSSGRQNESEQNESPHMAAARNYINNGRYEEALKVLESIQDRNARWYYYSAKAHAGLGNRAQAQSFAQRAAAMDPNNLEYRLFLNQLTNPGQQYGNFGSRYNAPTMDISRYCFWLCMASMFCRFCRC